MLVGVALIVLIGILGLAVDMGYVRYREARIADRRRRSRVRRRYGHNLRHL